MQGLNELKVREGRTDKGSVKYGHPEQEYVEYNGSPTTHFAFVQPVFIKAGTSYTISAQIFGDDSFKCYGCSPTVESDDGLRWTFVDTQFTNPETSNNTGPTKGIFPDLIYYKIR